MSPVFIVTEVSNNVRDWTAQGRYAMREYRVHLMPSDSTTPLLNVEWSRKADSPAPVEGQRVEGDVEDRGPHGLKFRQAQNPLGGMGARPEDPARAARIKRMHSQDMALRTLALVESRPGTESAWNTTGELFELIRKTADWFDKDAEKDAS